MRTNTPDGVTIRNMTEYADYTSPDGSHLVQDGHFSVSYEFDDMNIWTQLMGSGSDKGFVYSAKVWIPSQVDRAATQDELWSCLATTILMYKMHQQRDVTEVPEELPRRGY